MGRHRKVGVAKKGSGNALAQRYYRARKVFLEGGKPNHLQRRDMRNYLKYLKTQEHGNCRSQIPRVEEIIRQVEDSRPMSEKVTGRKPAPKKTTTAKKKTAPKTDVKVVSLAEQYKVIIDSLLAGHTSSEFTLIPTKKASTNHTVTPIIEIQDGMTLCRMK